MMDFRDALKVTNDSIEDGRILEQQFEYSYLYSVKLALEKGTPAKPNKACAYDKGSYRKQVYRCPNCGHFIGSNICGTDIWDYQDKFCNECGQAIDWSDTDAAN